MFRKKIIIVVIVLAVSLILFRLFLLDPIAKNIMVKTGQALFGAKVDIVDVDFSLSQGRMIVSGIDVGDKNQPFRNLFSIRRAVFDIDPRLLIYRKYHINEAAVDGLEFGTRRKTSAALVRKDSFVSKKVREFVTDLKEYYSLESIGKRLQLNELTDFSSLKTVEKIDQAAEKVETLPDRAGRALNQQENLERIARLEKEVNEILSNVPQNVPQYPAYLKKLEILLQEIEAVRKEISAIEGRLADEYDTTRISIEEAVGQSRQDIKTLKDKIQLAKVKQANLLESIIGIRYVAMADNVRNIMGIAKKFMPDKVPGKKTWVDRFIVNGQDIFFPVRKTHPKLLIEEVRLSGIWPGGATAFTGKISEIVTNQDLRGIPTTFSFRSTGDTSQGSLQVKGSADFRNGRERYAVKVNNSNVELKPSYWDEQLIPFRIARGTYDMNTSFTMNEGQFGSDLFITTHETFFEPAKSFDPSNIFHEILREVVAEHHSFTVAGSYVDGNVSVTSNVDTLIARQIDAYVQARVTELRQNLEKQWNEQVVRRIEQLQQSFSEVRKQAEQQVRSWQRELNVLQQRIEQERKAIEERVEKETSRIQNDVRTREQEIRKEVEQKTDKELDRLKKSILGTGKQ